MLRNVASIVVFPPAGIQIRLSYSTLIFQGRGLDGVQIFTSTSEHGLRDYALTTAQWKLAEHLVPVLELFNDLTNVCSRAEVPLICDVVPMLESLEHSLDRVYNATEEPAVIRIAAKAALQIVGKYYALTDDDEVYRIAIVMCPDKKNQVVRPGP
ncbi:hypothetical protein BDR03DRAFT_466694 [Suillus americanus]|nr:hypothetical protein BDR03DRAFT_466694 [Suillus americanus]